MKTLTKRLPPVSTVLTATAQDNHRSGLEGGGIAQSRGVANVQRQLAATAQAFKALVAQADQQALLNQGEISPSLADQIRATFQRLCLLLNEWLGDASPLAPEDKQRFGSQLQSEFLPYLLLASIAERSYAKPRGYAGDFLTIAEMYENQPRGIGRVGWLLDQCFLDVPAAIAVQNRRQLLVEEIQRTVAAKPGQAPVYVTTLACGPAAEVFDAFAQVENPERLHVTLIDIDEQALAYVDAKAAAQKVQPQMHLHAGNLIHLALGRQRLELPPQDLVYSIGLIDYLQDGLVVKLTNWVHRLLRPGGRVVLGNFHPRNASKAFMDYVLDWKLIHRAEADMDHLYQQSAFQRPSTQIRFEAQGINLFAECIK